MLKLFVNECLLFRSSDAWFKLIGVLSWFSITVIVMLLVWLAVYLCG